MPDRIFAVLLSVQCMDWADLEKGPVPYPKSNQAAASQGTISSFSMPSE